MGNCRNREGLNSYFRKKRGSLLKFPIYYLFFLLSFGIQIGEAQMESKTLIQLLNYSRTLIQDGEIKFLLYKQYPTHPDDVGAKHRKLLTSLERQLRENPPKSKNPEALRKKILDFLEKEKKYGDFRDSTFSFVEANLVFQDNPQSGHRMQIIARFENYPSFGHTRFFNAGGQYCFYSNGTQAFRWDPPGQFANDRRVGHVEERATPTYHEVNMMKKLPPTDFIDETQAEVDLSEDSSEMPNYIITFSPREKTKAKVYVRLKNGLPEVYREEFYFKGDSPQADAEGYRLGVVYTYSDFQWVEALNISVPRVRENRHFRKIDGFMRFHSIMTIKEMDFNLGLPANFFDWKETKLTGNNDKHNKTQDDVKKDAPQETQE